MIALRIVEHLDLIEHILPRFYAGSAGPASDPFAFEHVEEALHDRVVMAVTAAAHGMFQIVDT